MRIRLLLLLVPLFLMSCGTKKIAVSKLQEDINYLEKSITEIHPTPFVEMDSIEYAEVFKNASNSIKHPLNEHQFYRKVAPIVAQLNDGHSETIFPNKTQIKAFFWGSKIPSFEVIIIGDKVYIDVDCSKKHPSIRGMEILEINDRPITSILEEMLTYEEGKRIAFRKEKVELNWERQFFENSGYSGNFKLKLKNPATNEIINHRVKGISQVAYYKRRSKIHYPSKPNRYSKLFKKVTLDSLNQSGSIYLKVDSANSVAFISYYTFMGKEDSTALHEVFKYIKRNNIKNLIFDVRRNGGGNTNYFDGLFSYLTNDTIMLFSRAVHRLSNQYMDDLSYNKDSILMADNAKIGDTVCFYRGKDELLISDNPLRFDGKLFVLCSNYTFSTASSFCAIIKDYGIGTLVGTETGGLGNSFGDPMIIQLPNSKLLVRISTKKLFRPIVENGDHIQPDIVVQPTYESVFGNSKPLLDVVYKNLTK